MTSDYRDEHEPNWVRGVHEGAHATAAWAMGGHVQYIECSEMPPDPGLGPWQTAVVAHAGKAAERIAGNPDAVVSGPDLLLLNRALDEITEAEGTEARDSADLRSQVAAECIVSAQWKVVESFGEPVGRLINQAAPRILPRADCVRIARESWHGTMPADLRE